MEPVTTVLQSSFLVCLLLCSVYSSCTVLLVLVCAGMFLWGLLTEQQRE